MSDPIVLRPIGRIRSALRALQDAPRQGSEGAPDAWLEVDPNEKRGTVRGMPIREDIQIPVQEQLIVELFSK